MMKPSKEAIRMLSEQEIAENLKDAGCSAYETGRILACLQEGKGQQAEKLIAGCRRKQLEKLHESQLCIDRLDYLSYQINRTRKDRV